MQTLKRIYGASFIFSLALAFTAYVNSTFVAEHITRDYVGVIYASAALLTLISLEVLPKIIRNIGNRTLILGLIVLNIIALAILRTHAQTGLLAAAFIIFNSTNSLIWYSLDIFIEHFSVNKKVGSIRGAYLSLTNIAWVFAPIATGTIVSIFGFSSLYSVVMIAIAIVGIILHFTLRSYHDGKYRVLSTLSAFRALQARPDLLRITAANFLLQFFYAWMVVYAPLYLHEYHHLSFETIGVMFTIMLVPFVILEYPIGRLIDSVHHERQFMQLGILIMAATTFLFGYHIIGASALSLALILFGTRAGAAIVEVTSESYFFKSVTDRDAEIIGLFRSTTPLAYLFAPLIATVILSYQPYQILFYILAAVLLLGIFIIDRLSNIIS